jgi:molecular chaperone DnaJ
MFTGAEGRDDLYVILEVGRSATVADIKKSFRRLARRFHPDVNPGDRRAEERFKRISEAYDVLSHPDKRHFYDENGFYTDEADGWNNPATAWGFTFRGFDFSGSSQSSMSGLFGATFSRPLAPRSPERGADLECQVSISFADSIAGLKARINIQRYRPCPSCTGSAGLPFHREISCAVCEGDGRTFRTKGRLRIAAVCRECHGTGHVRQLCEECGGIGRVSHMDSLDVQIPAGVSTASRVRIPGEGDVGLYGGPAGDLYVITNVAPHRFFGRVGEHIQCILPISFSEAALGTKIEVPTIDGSALVRIPPGTQNGQVFRMREKGAPSLLRPGARGDQLVEVRVVVPRIADERSKEILREFARLNSENLRKDIGIW